MALPSLWRRSGLRVAPCRPGPQPFRFPLRDVILASRGFNGQIVDEAMTLRELYPQVLGELRVVGFGGEAGARFACLRDMRSL